MLYFYFNSFQNIDEEEFGGPWELTKEGFITSFAGFLVSGDYLQGLKLIVLFLDVGRSLGSLFIQGCITQWMTLYDIG